VTNRTRVRLAEQHDRCYSHPGAISQTTRQMLFAPGCE